MRTGELCSRAVVVAGRRESAAAAASLMRHYHVGDVVVVDQSDGAKRPVGIVTDRDIVVEVVANGLDAEGVLLDDIMAEDVIAARDSDDVFDTMQSMRRHGIRRAPVVDGKGGLIGIVAVDDLVQFLAEEMDELAKLIRWEQEHEARTRK